MGTRIKIQNKGQVTIPTRLRAQAGLTEGDLVEAAFEDGKIVLTPKMVVDRAKLPKAEDAYTPAQRRVVDAQLAKAAKDRKPRRPR